jgi:hypothetical protein
MLRRASHDLEWAALLVEQVLVEVVAREPAPPPRSFRPGARRSPPAWEGVVTTLRERARE